MGQASSQICKIVIDFRETLIRVDEGKSLRGANEGASEKCFWAVTSTTIRERLGSGVDDYEDKVTIRWFSRERQFNQFFA